MAMLKRTVSDLSNDEKFEILRKWDRGVTGRALAEEFKSSMSTIYYVVKTRQQLDGVVTDMVVDSRRRRRYVENTTEDELYSWIVEHHEEGTILSEDVIVKKANEIYEKISKNKDIFKKKYTKQWFRHFRIKYRFREIKNGLIVQRNAHKKMLSNTPTTSVDVCSTACTKHTDLVNIEKPGPSGATSQRNQIKIQNVEAITDVKYEQLDACSPKTSTVHLSNLPSTYIPSSTDASSGSRFGQSLVNQSNLSINNSNILPSIDASNKSNIQNKETYANLPKNSYPIIIHSFVTDNADTNDLQKATIKNESVKVTQINSIRVIKRKHRDVALTNQKCSENPVIPSTSNNTVPATEPSTGQIANEILPEYFTRNTTTLATETDHNTSIDTEKDHNKRKLIIEVWPELKTHLININDKYSNMKNAPNLEEKTIEKSLAINEDWDDDVTTFAANVKARMRSFDPEQQYIAQKLISDIMLMAENKQLQLMTNIIH